MLRDGAGQQAECRHHFGFFVYDLIPLIFAQNAGIGSSLLLKSFLL